ncbi:MAG: nitrilase-related carbon-nitrogen hydrolase, partial [Pseudomonadota bacterium]
MTATLDLVLAQLNPVVGDVAGNTDKVIDAALRARDRFGAHLVVLPELFLSGYPPEDLLFHKGLKRRTEAGLKRIQTETQGIAVLVGFPEYDADGLYNAAALIDNGRIVAHYRKWLLPNYRVFDEKRYFESGSRPCVVELRGVRIGLQICEDIWQPEPAAAARTAGAEVLLAINGSPYQIGAQARREQVAAARVRETRLPLIYVNMIGGQDELVFDGGSFVMNDAADVVMRADDSDEQLIPVSVEADSRNVHPLGGEVVPLPGDEESVYRALVRGTHDYVEKNGFPGVILGLSGGVDSALTLAVAVDALGAERVHAVMMPYRYTSEMSRSDAAEQARTL